MSLINKIKIFSEKMIKNFCSRKGQSIAEFAVITAMMSTFIATAAPRLSDLMEEGKAQKSIQEIDKLLIQAKNLDSLLKRYNQKIDIVLKLSVSLKTVKKRILERQIQENREDDNEEVAIKRYNTYEKSSSPVIEYYKQSNLLKFVNGEAGISEINTEIRVLIDAIKG